MSVPYSAATPLQMVRSASSSVIASSEMEQTVVEAGAPFTLLRCRPTALVEAVPYLVDY